MTEGVSREGGFFSGPCFQRDLVRFGSGKVVGILGHLFPLPWAAAGISVLFFIFFSSSVQHAMICPRESMQAGGVPLILDGRIMINFWRLARPGCGTSRWMDGWDGTTTLEVERGWSFFSYLSREILRNGRSARGDRHGLGRLGRSRTRTHILRWGRRTQPHVVWSIIVGGRFTPVYLRIRVLQSKRSG